MKKLFEIATIFSGNAWKADSFRANGKLPIIRIQNIGKNKSSDFVYWDEDYKESFIVNKGEILLSLSGSIKLDFWDGPPALLNQRIVKITPKDGINSKWLYYQLSKYVRKIELMGRNAVVNNVSLPDLKNISLNVPSLPTQLHIASILSKAENLIAQRKESIRLLDEFLKSTFLEMFGDVKGEKVPITAACVLNPKKSEISELNKTTEVSFIPMANVSEKGEVNLSQTRTLESVWNGFTYFREDDVVFAKITPCMENGKGAIMKNLKNKIGFGTTEFHVLRPIDGVSTSAWLYHLSTQDSFRKKAEQNMTGSAGQKRVPTDYFERYKVVIPPITLQTQFAHIVEKTETLKTQYQQSLQELENLYGSLSQKAFRGELGVKAVSK